MTPFRWTLSGALLLALGCTDGVEETSSRDHGSVSVDDTSNSAELEADSGLASMDAAVPGSTPPSGVPSDVPPDPVTVSELAPPVATLAPSPAPSTVNMIVDASAPVGPYRPEPPPNEPSVADNSGVWVLAGVVAHGLGDE